MHEPCGDRVVEWDLAVIGLGYVGLPIVREAARRGMRVVGVDAHADRVNRLNAGVSHVDDISDGEVAGLVSQEFRATIDPRPLASADTVIICVPTPLDTDRRPDLSAVTAAAETVAERLRPGTLVVL